MKRITSLLILLCVFLVAIGQEGADDRPQMADALRSNGKIYVVVAVVVTILLGLFVYLFRLDRKISKLEKGK
jgi:CcmD family protein